MFSDKATTDLDFLTSLGLAGAFFGLATAFLGLAGFFLGLAGAFFGLPWPCASLGNVCALAGFPVNTKCMLCKLFPKQQNQHHLLSRG